MLGESAQQAIDKLQPGDISGVVTLLEGVALFRLDDRQPAKLSPLNQIRERAIALWKRDRQEQARNSAVQALLEQATVVLTNVDYRHLSKTNTTQPAQNYDPNSKTN